MRWLRRKKLRVGLFCLNFESKYQSLRGWNGGNGCEQVKIVAPHVKKPSAQDKYGCTIELDQTENVSFFVLKKSFVHDCQVVTLDSTNTLLIV